MTMKVSASAVGRLVRPNFISGIQSVGQISDGVVGVFTTRQDVAEQVYVLLKSSGYIAQLRYEMVRVTGRAQ